MTPEEKHERFGRLSEVVRAEGLVLSSRYKLHRHNPWYDFGDDANLFVYLLNSTPYGGTDDPALLNVYSEIVEKAKRLDLSEDSIQAFRREVKKDPGFVLDADLQDLRRVTSTIPKTRIKVAVVHHNPNHVPSDDRENFDTIINAGPLKSVLLESGFHIVLHGHRHIFHCSVETHPATSFAQNQCSFLSADSLGCKEHAPFLELQISCEGGTTAPTAQGARVAVREFSYSHPTGYGAGVTRFEAALIRTDMEQLANLILTNEDDPASVAKVKQAVNTFLPKLQQLHDKLTQWNDGTDWVKQFHFQLRTYRRLWATALYDGPIMSNHVYQRYLREQYTERFNRLGRIKEKSLYFSPEVMRAIVRCQWQPAQELWGGYKVQISSNPAPPSLEIARIIVLGSQSVDLIALQNLAYDHSLCAIPLFVIERKYLNEDHAVDFAIGTDADGGPVKACAFDKRIGAVQEQTLLDSYELVTIFEQLLMNRHLRTAHEFVGHQRMWTDRAEVLTKRYADVRKSSPLLVDILMNHLPEQGDMGVDLCCGTGNYTAPFVKRFRKVSGVDISPQMISEARKRVPGVIWIQADAKDSTLPDNSCEGAWMISALHYFLGEEQLLLFREIHRVLKPGGVFVADTEFLEQHPSLWIVDYFPSLKQRYQDRLFGQAQYRTWLSEAGFSDVRFETHDYGPEQGDAFLRIGQHKPDLYLNTKIQDAMPAFQLMDPLERKKGFERLRDEIATRETQRIRDAYMSNAQVSGDIGIIIATK